MSQVNLLPPEIREVQQRRRLTALVGLGGVAVLALVGAFYFLQTRSLSEAEDKLAAQQQANRRIQAEISQLTQFADLQAKRDARQALVDTVYENEISWSSVLQDVSQVIPDEAVLDSFSGSLTVATGTPVGGEEAVDLAVLTGLVGNLQFSGQAVGEETVALWLTKQNRPKGWANPWLSSAQETEERSNIYEFTSSADLDAGVVTDRGRRAMELEGQG